MCMQVRSVTCQGVWQASGMMFYFKIICSGCFSHTTLDFTRHLLPVITWLAAHLTSIPKAHSEHYVARNIQGQFVAPSAQRVDLDSFLFHTSAEEGPSTTIFTRITHTSIKKISAPNLTHTYKSRGGALFTVFPWAWSGHMHWFSPKAKSSINLVQCKTGCYIGHIHYLQ